MDDYWNRLIKVRDNAKKPTEVRDKAAMLLSQLNTAGGKQLLEKELKIFLRSHD